MRTEYVNKPEIGLMCEHSPLSEGGVTTFNDVR